MKKSCPWIIAIIICLSVLSGALALDHSDDTFEIAAKSVLKLSVFEFHSDTEPFATGSGFVAFDNSTLITNYHVIEDAAYICGTDDDGNTYVLNRVLCADQNADIAILEFENPTNLKPLELYPDDHLKRGSRVYAIGSPKGLKNTVSDGVVSYQYTEDGIPWIQITAPISPGSSGGALLNEEGKVIGVTTASYKNKDEYGEDTNAQNINFAVNIATAQAMYNAWDGRKSFISNPGHTAKMDFTGIYQHTGASDHTDPVTDESNADQETGLWTCLNCGKENTTKFCLNCGAEKPYWICACGQTNSSNNYCGNCGKSYADLINDFNNAIKNASKGDYSKALEMLHELGKFNSGSFVTVEGDHIEAQHYMMLGSKGSKQTHFDNC